MLNLSFPLTDDALADLVLGHAVYPLRSSASSRDGKSSKAATAHLQQYSQLRKGLNLDRIAIECRAVISQINGMTFDEVVVDEKSRDSHPTSSPSGRSRDKPASSSSNKKKSSPPTNAGQQFTTSSVYSSQGVEPADVSGLGGGGATGVKPPKISGHVRNYQRGNEVLELNCTSSGGNPPPLLEWYVNINEVSQSRDSPSQEMKTSGVEVID